MSGDSDRDILGITPPRGRSAVTFRRQQWWRELLIAVALYAVYDVIHGVITGSTTRAQLDGRDLLGVERLLHLDPELYLNRMFGHAAALAVPACFFYATLHFVITPVVLIWTYRNRPAAYRQARTVLGAITLSALIGFWLYPTAPPRLLTGGGFQDTLVHYRAWGWWGSEASVPAAVQAIANEYAAMPSLHLAWAAWCAATVYTLTRRRCVRAAALCYPILTALVVIGTANHYLLDVLAGAALWIATQTVVRFLTGPRQRRPMIEFVTAHPRPPL